MTFKNQSIKVIISDDEPSARESMKILLSREKDVEIVAECIDGKDTINAITTLKPDLVFLDIQMPEMNGFEVLLSLNKQEIPLIIFVTAFDKFAIKAFEISALDYLLKPYDDERFYQSLEKAKKMLQLKQIREQNYNVEDLFKYLQQHQQGTNSTYPKRLSIKNNNKISFLSVDSIYYIESEGNFVKFHLSDSFKIGNYTFKSLSELVDPEKFVRVHKSYIVNVDIIETIENHLYGDYILQLKNGVQVKLSRNYRNALDSILKP